MYLRNFLGSLLLLLVSVATASAQNSNESPKTYCNPLPLPDYPIGRLARDIVPGEKATSRLWLRGYQEQFRELADPTALWENGKWYLYPSADMAWESDDQGGTWQHRPLNIRDVGYAPTVVKHEGRYLLIACKSDLYAADSPLGFYRDLGPLVLPADSKAPLVMDPMLFSDQGRLFLYWGCTPSGGIWGAELDSKNPTRMISPPIQLIFFRPDLFPWEKVGEHNEKKTGWIEGSWMLKENGKYYLTYSAAGTENSTYAMGCYVGNSPLGPFQPQTRNPILRTTEGLITGTGHGCIVAGPEGRLWAFFCVRAGISHAFERRVGMDRAEIDANGDLAVDGATQYPQWLPAERSLHDGATDTGWRPLARAADTVGSTSIASHAGDQAADDDLRTWWQPEAVDSQPTLTSSFAEPAMIRSCRVIWRDTGLDTGKGINPGPFRYRIEAETTPGQWKTIIDRTKSAEDLLIDYRECPPVVADKVRLVVTDWPKGIIPSVCEFTAFGDKAGK